MTCSFMAEGIAWGPEGMNNIVHPTGFSVTPGQILAIVGPNGAGKSTLLKMLYRFVRPRSGQIKLNGECIWKVDARTCARKIAAVLQEQTADISLTVREIVSLGRIPHRNGFISGSRRDHLIVDEVMERLELQELSSRHPCTLSGGEKQRVMFARALAQEPDIIVLDEPTNHLDIRHQLELLELMRGMGPSIVCTLHDLNLAVQFADEILILSKGRTLAYGVPNEVINEQLLSEAFSVDTQIDHLQASGSRHFTFKLPQLQQQH